MTEKTPPPLTAEEEKDFVNFADAINSFLENYSEDSLDEGHYLGYSEDDIAEEIELLGTYV